MASRRRFAFKSRNGRIVQFTDKRRPFATLQMWWMSASRKWDSVYAHVEGSEFVRADDVTPCMLVRHIPQEDMAALMAMSIEEQP